MNKVDDKFIEVKKRAESYFIEKLGKEEKDKLILMAFEQGLMLGFDCVYDSNVYNDVSEYLRR